MPSNINPSLEPTKSLVNFRFWCQKVLPLVYDDSLSYYEVLGKMVVQLNDVIDNVNTDTDNVLTLKDAFLELQTYVNNFFADIDQLASYAERAEAAQTAANTSAINAASSASNASASSLAAMGARDAAVTAKEAAQTSANTANEAATNANTKANEAAQSAITAQTAQASASQSATLAATDRSAAQTAASTATTKASEANTSATNAETSANNAAESKNEAESLVNSVRENLDNIQQNTQDIEDIKETIGDIENNYPTNTIQGFLPTIYDGADGANIVEANFEGECRVLGESLPFTRLNGYSLDDTGKETASPAYCILTVNVENMDKIGIGGYKAAAGYRQLKIFAYNEDETEITNLIAIAGAPDHGFSRSSRLQNAHHIKLSWANNYTKIVFSNVEAYYNSAADIKTFKGENTFVRTNFEMNITYRCDITEYVKNSFKVVAKVLNDMIADKALVINDFRIVNNKLYKVTAPIASGGTLTVGTNVVATTVAEVLKSLLN